MGLKSANTRTLPSPSTSPTPPKASSEYRSAYNHGIITRPDGEFDHFVRLLDQTHLRTGYWKFSSFEDDRRAHNHGFSTPEEILIAQDRDDGSYDNISLRWIRGEDDANLSMVLVGSAAQHLETIYELRGILGMPMSFQGQIPFYPTGQDIRLKKYWEMKQSAKQTAVLSRPQSNYTPPSLRAQPNLQNKNTISALYPDGKTPDILGNDKDTRVVSYENQTKIPLPKTYTSTHSEAEEIEGTKLVPHKESLPKQRSHPESTSNYAHRDSRTSRTQPFATSKAPTLRNILNAPAPTPTQPYTSFDSLDQSRSRSVSTDGISHHDVSPYDSPPFWSRPSSHNSTQSSPSPHTFPPDAASPLQSNLSLKSTTSPPVQSPQVNSGQSCRSSRANVPAEDTLRQPKGTSSVLRNGLRSFLLEQIATADIYSAEEKLQRAHTKQSQTAYLRDVRPIAVEKLDAKAYNGPTRQDHIGSQHGEDTNTTMLPNRTQLSPIEVKMYATLPCIDCGLEDGHKWDCHIGSKFDSASPLAHR